MDQLTDPSPSEQPASPRGRLVLFAAILLTVALVGTAADAATTWTVPVAANSYAQAQAGTLAAPTGVAANCTGGGANNKVPVTVSWTAAALATSYTIGEATTSSGTYTTIATGVTGTSYSYTPPDGTHYWKVTAIRANWSSPSSAPTPTGRTTLGNGNCS
jgi:hypothetical protein